MKLSKEAKELKKLDPILSTIIIEELEAFENDNRRSESVYESLLRAIISQQISVAAANSIRNKFLKLYNKKEPYKFPEPKKLLKTSDEKLKTAGLSSSKISYLKNVAEHFIKENLNDEKFKEMSDREIIEDLIKIKGVGEWTVEMILMFALDRKDVFSYKDLALVTPIIKLYKIKKEKHTPKKLKEKIFKITNKWSPHRTLASKYLWKYSGELKKVKTKDKI